MHAIEHPPKRNQCSHARSQILITACFTPWVHRAVRLSGSSPTPALASPHPSTLAPFSSAIAQESSQLCAGHDDALFWNWRRGQGLKGLWWWRTGAEGQMATGWQIMQNMSLSGCAGAAPPTARSFTTLNVAGYVIDAREPRAGDGK